jgi:hypothetical protein
MIPPSPSLSARMITSTYFSVTTRISDQKPSDSRPLTVRASGLRPKCGLNISLIVYSGLVPMSPNTTPTAATTNAAMPSWAWLPPRAVWGAFEAMWIPVGSAQRGL